MRFCLRAWRQSPGSRRASQSWAKTPSGGGCWKLETLDLPEGLTTIGQDARSACEQLREVRLPSKLKEIGRYAFHETLRPVKKLERLDIPEGVTKIGDYAFGCRPRLTGIFQPL